jgi:hypothetical protein
MVQFRPTAAQGDGMLGRRGVHDGISANLLYGFERFMLQSIQSGHVKVTFLLKGHVLERRLPSREKIMLTG